MPAGIFRAIYERFQRSAAEHHGVGAFPVRSAAVLEQVHDTWLVDDWNDVMVEYLERCPPSPTRLKALARTRSNIAFSPAQQRETSSSAA